MNWTENAFVRERCDQTSLDDPCIWHSSLLTRRLQSNLFDYHEQRPLSLTSLAYYPTITGTWLYESMLV